MIWRLSVPLLALVWSCGCSTFVSSRSQKEALMAQYQAGNVVQAAAIATERAEKRADTGDELMWRLEEGSTRLAAGDAAGSLVAFERAEAVIADHEQRAVVNAREVGAEGGAVLTNPNVLPYTGTYAEKIMLNTEKALAYFAQGDTEGARVELRRAYERQRQAQERYAAEIEEANKKAQERQFTAEQLLTGSPELQAVNTDLDRAAGTVLGDYVNPFTTYLSGISYLWQGNLGEALVDFRNLHQMMPDHPRIRRDYATVLKATGSSNPPELGTAKPWPYPLDDNICLIIVEDGLIAARREQRIHIPLPPPVGYTGVAFPVPEYFPRAEYKVVVRAPALRKRTTLLKVADMDGISARAYRMELPVMITRLAVSVIVKETANLAAMYAVRDQNAAVQIGTLIGTSLYKFVTNRADVRSWQCLPGEYRVGHLPMPPDGRFEVNGQLVELPPGTHRALLWIRVVPGGSPSVQAFPMKNSP